MVKFIAIRFPPACRLNGCGPNLSKKSEPQSTASALASRRSPCWSDIICWMIRQIDLA